jgi:hypothetical protein
LKELETSVTNTPIDRFRKPGYTCAPVLIGLLLILLGGAPARADDGWKISYLFPFGSVSPSPDIGRGTVYSDPTDGKTYMYFGVDNSTSAEVFRSSDGVTWNLVNVSGFGLIGGSPVSSEVTWLADFNVQPAGFGAPYDFLYAGGAQDSGIPLDGAQIYRSQGGSSLGQWTLVFSSKTTHDANNKTPGGGNGVTFNNAFYIGTKNSVTGGEVWKSTSADSEVSWIQVSSAGFNEGPAVNPNISYLKSFNDATSLNAYPQPYLYAATNCPTGGAACGQIWMSTGTAGNTDIDTWHQVLVASNTFDATGHTFSVSALESFNGFLYATTLNSLNEAQMWRSANPDLGTGLDPSLVPGTPATWTQIFSPDSDCATCFAFSTTTEIHTLRNVGGVLYASLFDSNGGLVVYRSSDGATGTWVRSNAIPGFGNANREYFGDFLALNGLVYGNLLNPNASAIWHSSPAPPGTPVGTGLGISSVSWTWATDPGYNSYSILQSSGLTYLGSVAAPPFVIMGLSTNTLSSVVVEGVTGPSTGTLSASATIYTLAAAPTSFMLLQVLSSSITVSWGPNQNPAGTVFQVSYYDTVIGTTVTVAGVANTVSLTGLIGNDTYYLTVAALNGSNVQTPAGVTLSTYTLPSSFTAATIGPGGGTIFYNPPQGIIELNIPPRAFTQPVVVTLSTPTVFPAPTSNAATLVPTAPGVGVQIDVSGGIEPLVNSVMIVHYPAASIAGLIPTQLVLAWYDTTHDVWVPLPSSPSPTNAYVAVVVDHFSEFQIMQSNPSTSVTQAKIFPNPLRPSLGQTLMTFSELPANSRVRIYTLTGVLLRDMTADATGLASWDGTNQAGNRVASGVYFVFAQSGTQGTTFKVAIER